MFKPTFDMFGRVTALILGDDAERERLKSESGKLNNNRKLTIACMSILAVGLGFVLYTTDPNGPKVFAFEWSPEEQEMVNGTLRMWISFMWKNENLSVFAKINDRGNLGLVFDRNGNGKIDYEGADIPYFLAANNVTCYDPILWDVEDPRVVPSKGVHRSPYHTCVFTEDGGCLYNVTIPRNELAQVKANIVLICYQGGSAFNLDWVSAWAKGWH